MLVLKFKTEIYDWVVTYIEITHKDNHIKKKLKKHGLSKAYIKDRLPHIKKNHQGGDHVCNYNFRESIIVIYNCKSKKAKTNVVAHEKRHLEDSILTHWGINDREANATLAGYIAEMLLKVNA